MEIFSDLDPAVKILSLGISGFCFLLVIMSFKLISDEQKKDTPRKTILSAIYIFMGINFLNVVVVGILGIPAIARNQKLQADKVQTQEELSVKQNELSFIQKSNEINSVINLPKDGGNPASSNDDSLTKHSENYLVAYDSLVKSYDKVSSPTADSLKKYRPILQHQIDWLRSDTASSKGKAIALKKLNHSNTKLNRLVWQKSKMVAK